jgi:DNA-binding transcriptional MerR regulator
MIPQTYTLDEISKLVDLPRRTIRYYMQLGLVDRPVGETRAAQYSARQLDQLIRVKQLSSAGISLERIKDVMDGAPAPVPPRTLRPGDIQVRSQVFIARGVELQIDPELARLSPESLRAFVKAVVNQWEMLHDNSEDT